VLELELLSAFYVPDVESVDVELDCAGVVVLVVVVLPLSEAAGALEVSESVVEAVDVGALSVVAGYDVASVDIGWTDESEVAFAGSVSSRQRGFRDF